MAPSAMLRALLLWATSVRGDDPAPYQSLHLVDLQKIICPGGPGYFDVELSQTQLSGAKQFMPHVVTFLRSSGQAVDITYTLINGDGTQWQQGTQTVTLQALGRRLREGNSTDTKAFLSQALEDVEDLDEPDQDDPEQPEEDLSRRLAARRRSSSGSTSSPRRRSASSTPSPRRRSTSSTSSTTSPRRRTSSSTSTTSPRRRTSSSTSTTSPRRRSSSSDSRRRTSSSESSPRRRGGTTLAAHRRRATTSNQPPGDNRVYSTASTGGTPYTPPSTASTMQTYGGSYPQQASYGYSGTSAYGMSGSSGKSNGKILAAAAGGLVAGAGGYYLYDRLTSSSCQGYTCCYGCSNSCYGRSGCGGSCYDCDQQMTGNYYQDDMMVQGGFYPSDVLPFPVKVRISSVSGAGYSSTAICPPSTCTQSSDLSSSECQPASGTTVNSLYVTLTVMLEVNDMAASAFGLSRWSGTTAFLCLMHLARLLSNA